ncbi:Hypothetical Protein FCC1311_000672 [Hondaea fermentalgiana]|uniref:Uncharacterized protein n=1 Tax=Hondaea fermentalgiana TaxID=2315210 RepID=A0A2R5FYL6_9STRA|nr:Hypothetical Protein FCC1311_000672 [Hondaea fermentalgiana]|eukprot:GBG23847.1 Hypothetical Protein FCC1311_000672 [Hondaea fermentalgiana]
MEPMEAASWNVAAINNNPFEYWISYDDDAYNGMMEDVQRFIEAPGDDDVPVSEVINDGMVGELMELMKAYGWTDLDAVEAKWNDEFRDRKIVSGFLKDKEIGNKRLASMLDRVTNTINLADGSQAYRPTPINCYQDTFSSFADWWAHWKTFMFKDKLRVRLKGKEVEVLPADLLLPIKRSKYPAITPEEEAMSLPLQTICAAAFDGILVHMLNKVAGQETWQDLRKQLSNALNRQKNVRTLQVLDETYGSADVIFLQEVAGAFITSLEQHPSLSQRYSVLAPVTSGKRDQLSVILIKKGVFDASTAKDVTDAVAAKFPSDVDVPVAEGDLAAFLVASGSGTDTRSFLLASFHGDTNGLATIPVVKAVTDYVKEDLESGIPLLFGLDANTYEEGKPGKTQDVLEFGKFFVEQGLTSTWGDVPRPTEYTTFNARTFLQPQLNKAVTKEEVRAKGDVNPKDFILFFKDQMEASTPTVKDNTGDRTFVEAVFPTLTFPSDHAVISAKVKLLDA